MRASAISAKHQCERRYSLVQRAMTGRHARSLRESVRSQLWPPMMPLSGSDQDAGAVLGKALSTLTTGQGLIPILVGLQ